MKIMMKMMKLMNMKMKMMMMMVMMVMMMMMMMMMMMCDFYYSGMTLHPTGAHFLYITWWSIRMQRSTGGHPPPGHHVLLQQPLHLNTLLPSNVYLTKKSPRRSRNRESLYLNSQLEELQCSKKPELESDIAAAEMHFLWTRPVIYGQL